MEPIKFKGQNRVFGENQPQYKPLPAMLLPGVEGEVITCWSVSEEEAERIRQNGCIYFSQFTFNAPLQPIRPMVDLDDGVELLPDTEG